MNLPFNQDKFTQAWFSLWERTQEEAPPFSLHIFDTLASTNQHIWQLLNTQGKTHKPVAVIALKQTGGKGQWGRVWQSPLGGLYLSVALNLHIKITDGLPLTLATAWGIAHTLRNYQIPVQLKWPNDLILKGSKLGGILTETRMQKNTITQAVIGVGINWSNPVPEKAINLQSFCQQQSTPSITCLEMLAAITLKGIFSGNQAYINERLEELISSYSELLCTTGRSVTINGLPGKVIGVDPNGQLKIRLTSSGATTEILCPPGTIRLGYD